ncbi:hypothetical protein [Herbaspirillum huttiense]|uniref:Uncharacterized protein n=1 Tax=Herbaspirillum huttiense subsp. lycopersici TaxID=3074428 RepID=A0ABU2EG09_9BURK|nr:hypothetical protein [Herbaspirillum huttiense]MDR9847074.1 hypothetical protein [Herbaspirillum huttiense SE1]
MSDLGLWIAAGRPLWNRLMHAYWTWRANNAARDAEVEKLAADQALANVEEFRRREREFRAIAVRNL